MENLRHFELEFTFQQRKIESKDKRYSELSYKSLVDVMLVKLIMTFL